MGGTILGKERILSEVAFFCGLGHLELRCEHTAGAQVWLG